MIKMTWSWRRVGVSAMNSRRAKKDAKAKKSSKANSPRQKAIAKTISRGQEARTRELTTKVIELCFVSLSTGYQPVADDRADG